VLIFDDTIQEKAWTDENEVMCWHFDHCSGRSVRGINLLNALYSSGDQAEMPEVKTQNEPFCVESKALY